MNLSQINIGSKVPFITITKPTIIHLVPDFGRTVYELIHQSGLKLNNCRSIVTKSRPLKLGGKLFNARKLYLDTKAALSSPDDDKKKRLRVLRSVPDNIQKGTFICIDHTITSQASRYITNLTNSKRGLFFLFQQLTKEFKYVKSKFPNFENTIMFLVDPNKEEEIPIQEVLKRILTIAPKDLNTNFRSFDNKVLVSLKLKTGNSTIFPIMGVDDHGKAVTYKANLIMIDKLVDKFEPTLDDLTKIKSLRSVDKSALPIIKAISKVDISQNVEIKNDNIKPKLEVNQKQLSRILRKYKVRDKSIGDNIKASVDNYIASDPDVQEEDLEQTILKSIHKTVFGTDIINQDYLDNPAKLISKIEEVNTYSEDINIPKTKSPHIIEAKDIVGLDRVTGLVRQKYEFSSNIHGNIKKLFKSLEDRSDHPIKIKSFKHDYQDNHLNRVINYEITLVNQAGGFDKPYTVNIKVPAIVNDRYFKLNGKQYILANQQFFSPVTKTAPQECRLLTSYATMTLSVVNMKFNISELGKIISYIEVKYPELIEKMEMLRDKIVAVNFKDGTRIDLLKSPYYVDGKTEMLLSNHKLVIKKDGVEEIPITEGRSEFIFQKLLSKIQAVNSNETLKKTVKSLPYLQMHLSGVKLALILYLWQQLGLISALHKLGIDYRIIKKESYTGGASSYALKDDKLLVFDKLSKREELIINGLFLIDKKKFTFAEDELNQKEAIEGFIQYKNGSRSVYQLNNNTENMMDPITKDLLEFQDKPTNMIGLIIDDMVPKLLNDQPDSLTDLKIYRSRQAEIMFHLMYKELMMAHSEYKRNLNFGNEEAKVFLKPDYIIECLLGVHVHSKGNSTLESVQTYNPVGELKLASKLIKTGPGGIPNKRSFKKEHRGIHKSYHGNIGANATSEYADVGIVNHMTLTPLISNQYGSYGIKDIKACSGWDLVSMDEALVPFINELDPTRAILAYTHRSQASPMINGEEPLVATGAEYIIPQLSSSRFIQRAKTDGIVKSVGEDDYVEVQYKDGTKEFIDITPRLATTKRASYVRLGLNHLEVGDKFKMNEMVAWTNTFNGECYASGKNMKMAVMNYMGYSHEDGYVISNNTAESVQTETVEEVSVIIPTGTKVHKLKYQKGQTEVNETLVEFSYVGDLEEYIDKYNLLDNESSEEDVALYSSIGNNIVISSPGGEISQIRIYLNNKNDADPLIIEFWKEIVSELKAKEKRYASTVKTKEKQLKAIDNLDMSQIKTGTHKYRGIQFEGARISFFIKKTNSLLIGDKLANRYGGKGVITKIIKDKDQPKAETFGDIDIFISPISVLGRKNLAVVKELYIGKIMYYLPLVLKEKVNDRRATSKSIRDLILSVYDELDTTPTKKVVQSIKDKFKIISDVKLRQLINDDKLKMNIIIEPFTNIPIENIKSAAELLDIELDERVWIPKTNTWTKTKVPVGMQYINSLEQLAEDYESLRSTGGYMSLTGQPKKGRADMGGQSIGNLDVYNLLTYNCPHVLEEFMTFRSDDFKNKRISTIDIIQNGNTSMPKKTGGAGTHNLHKVHMIAMGLKVE